MVTVPPLAPGIPVPPPNWNLAFVDLNTGRLTGDSYQFLQFLWSSIVGGGGIIDELMRLEPSFGEIAGTVESILSQRGDGSQTSITEILGRFAALQGVVAQQVMELQPPAPRRASEPIIRLMGNLPGTPTDGQMLFEIEMMGDEHFPAGLGMNLGSVDVAPAAAATFPITVNGAPIGSMDVAMAATDATWTMALPYNAARGDVLGFYAPSPADANLSIPRYTFAGWRS